MTHYLASSTRGAQIFMVLSLLGTLTAFGIYGVSTSALLLISVGYFVYGCNIS